MFGTWQVAPFQVRDVPGGKGLPAAVSNQPRYSHIMHEPPNKVKGVTGVKRSPPDRLKTKPTQTRPQATPPAQKETQDRWDG